jgi:hypothetical protein
MGLNPRPSVNREVQNRDRAGRIFRGESLQIRPGARAGQRCRQFAKPGIVPDQAHVLVGVGEQSRPVQERREGRVVKVGILFKRDFAAPFSGKDLGRLFGARRAGMDEKFGKKAPCGQRPGDPPCVRPSALGQFSRIVVAPDGEFSLGVTNEKQSVHGARLRKRSRIGKLLSSTAERESRAGAFQPPHATGKGAADQVGRSSP